MEIFRYKSFFVLPLLVGLWSAVAAAPEIRTVVSTDQTFRFVCVFDNIPAAIDPADSADLPAYIVQVAIPPQADVRLISAQGMDLQPVDGLLASENPLAEVGRAVWVRGRKLAGVRISPAAAGGCYRQVEVELSFEHKSHPVRLAQSYDPRYDNVLRSVVANYETARNWPVRERSRRTVSSAADESATDLEDADQWYQITTDRTGLYRVTGAQLAAAGINLTGLASDSIRMFNDGGLPLPIDNNEPRPTLGEISILVLDGGDGVFGSTDQIIFFAEATDRWIYEAGAAASYFHNPYTKQNVYWLAVSGSFGTPPLRMAESDGSVSGTAPYVVDSFTNAVHVEQDHLISLETDGHYWDYYNWYWSTESNLLLYVSTPGIADGDSAAVFVSAKSNRDVDLLVNGAGAPRITCTSTQCRFFTRALHGGDGQLNQFRFVLGPVGDGIPSYFDYVEVRYPAHLRPVSDQLDCYFNDLDGRVEVQATDVFSSVPTVLDVSDPLHPVVIEGFQRTGGLLNFETTMATDRVNRYYCEPLAQAQAPLSVSRADFTNVRELVDDQADLIIVTTRALRPYLSEYINLRQADGYATKTVAVEDIMQSFGFGMYDPTAIRDFLKYAYQNYPDPAPSAVLLVGDANYDILDNLNTGVPNYVPSYIRPTDRTYSDDNYVYFGDFGILDGDGDRQYDMMIARWSVRSAAEIATIVDKVKNYDASADFGSWRGRVTLVADDEHTNEHDNEYVHFTQTEELQSEHLPRVYNRNKIYLWDYPFVNGAKPAVNDAIVNAFNDGSLVVNYVGHGNPDVWAHEHVFQRGSDLARLNNYDRLPLVYAASCDIGFFDDPQREGMAEDLLVSTQGGAVAVISATRLVYSSDNAVFNRAVYDKLFGDNTLSIGEALFAAKLQRQYSSVADSIPSRVDNDRAYTLFGDPYVKLGRPHLTVEFTEYPDSLEALGVCRLAGRVVDGTDALYSYDGRLLVTAFDSERQKSYRIQNDTTVYRYNAAGPSIFRGSAGITNGTFDLSFVTPLDVTYRTATARVSAYAVFDATDAIGVVDSIPVGDQVAELTDSIGPQIDYAIVGRENFLSGDLVPSDNTLAVELSDPSGINLVGGIGHGITLVVDRESDKAITLSDNFEYDQDDYTTGRLTYALNQLGVGRHHLKLKAWDNANNAASTEFDLEITAPGTLAIHDLLNFPNPMGDVTTFYFQLTQPVNQITFEIFTLSGKNIWSRRSYSLGADSYPNSASRIVWDGRDDDGDRVATGVYLYKATAVPQNGGEAVEEFGKIVVVN